MKRLAAVLFLALFTLGVYAQQDQTLSNGKWAYYGEDFYKTLESRKSFERSMFKKIFNENHSSARGKFDEISSRCSSPVCYRHTTVGYDSARKIMFGELDTLRDRKGTFVIDVYCGKKFYFTDLDDVSDMHTKVNIEHTWPQSRFNGHYPKEMQKSDMHHLYLTDSQANSTRGNLPFGLVEDHEDRSGGEGCRDSRFGLINGGAVYTPPAPHRGNVARSLFYFAMHYDLAIGKQEEMILRQWNKMDPVDEDELERHEKIAKHQKVRNPFVDHPEIADRILDF
jgi:deoxyribonuclease I